MTEVLTKLVVDCSTGVETIEPLTAEELEQREIDARSYAEYLAEQEAAKKAEAEASESAKAKLLALGLTEIEIQTLLRGL